MLDEMGRGAVGSPVQWLRNEGVNMHPLTEDEARTEAARHELWQVVARDSVSINFVSAWTAVT